jgi:hypothetical protein
MIFWTFWALEQQSSFGFPKAELLGPKSPEIFLDAELGLPQSPHFGCQVT